jgi:hypothetical protein
MGVELDNQKLRLLKRQGDVLPTLYALPELAPYSTGENGAL